MKKYVVLLSLLMAANANSAIYVKFDGIEAPRDYVGKVGYVDIGNGKRIKMKVGEAGIVKSLDKASPKLLKQVCGKRLKFEEVKVTFGMLECR